MNEAPAANRYLGERLDGRPVDAYRDGHWPRWIEGAVIVGVWTVIAVLTVAQGVLDPRKVGPAELQAGRVLHALAYYGAWALLTPAVFWLSRRFRLEGGAWARHLLLHVVATVAFSLLIEKVFLVSVQVFLLPEGRAPFSFLRALFGLLFLDDLLLYLVVLAAGFARDYFLRYQERLQEAADLRAHAAELHAQLAEARLQTLRMQINPHFLFNTLNTVSAYLERDPRGVRRMIARLSELLRYTLDKTDVKEVPLRQELSFLEGYLEIQRIRFQDRLTVHEEIAPDVLEALVPNLILQPLVENAVKHGVGALADGGRIELRAWREGPHLHLSVRDDGPGLAAATGDGAAAPSEGIGLRNTRDRLESLYGTEQHLSLAPAAGGGVVAHLWLPYHTAADLYTSALPSQPRS